MSNLVSISNPLMLPVQYHGQTYYTGQYFHQMYRANSDAGGKYKQLPHFLRLIRSIETYPNYVESGDIVELEKADAELALASGEADPVLGSAFKATFGKLKQIAEALDVPLTFLTGAKGKPKLRVVPGGKPKAPVDKPTKPE